MLLDLLNALEAAGLIRRLPLEPEPEYLFGHALVQEAAYESLLKEDRRRLHRTVGEVLEAIFPGQREELAATLAHHFDLADDAPRALAYMLQAGNAAFERYAVAEAIVHYTRALQTARRSGPAVEVPWMQLYRNLGRALELDAQYERALEVYEQMEALARSRGDRGMELVALIEHAKVHATPNVAHDVAEGQALAERALLLSRELGDRAAEARIEWVMMIAAWMADEPQKSLAHGERSLALAREMGLREQLAYTLQDLHRARANTGDLAGAEAALEEARGLWRELNNLPMLADSLASTADRLLNSSEYDRAFAFAQEAWQLSQSIGNLWNQAFGRAMIGEIHQERGEWGAALQALHDAHDLSARAGLVILSLRLCRDLAATYLEINALEEARRFLQPACEDEHRAEPLQDVFWADAMFLLSRIEIRAGEIEAATAALDRVLREAGKSLQQRPSNLALVRGELALARGEHEQALGIVDELLDRAGGRLLPKHRLRFHHLRGLALLGLGRLGEAVALLGEAAHQARALGLRPHLWPILVALGRCESLLRNADGAAAAFGEARRVVEGLAASLPDPRLRESFLGRPEVQALLAL